MAEQTSAPPREPAEMGRGLQFALARGRRGTGWRQSGGSRVGTREVSRRGRGRCIVRCTERERARPFATQLSFNERPRFFPPPWNNARGNNSRRRRRRDDPRARGRRTGSNRDPCTRDPRLQARLSRLEARECSSRNSRECSGGPLISRERIVRNVPANASVIPQIFPVRGYRAQSP